jgi:hypothetical protein
MMWVFPGCLGDPRAAPDTTQKIVESCGTRSFVQLGEKLTTRAHMQKGEGSKRLGNQRHAKEAADWAEMGPGRPAQPIPGPSRTLL